MESCGESRRNSIPLEEAAFGNEKQLASRSGQEGRKITLSFPGPIPVDQLPHSLGASPVFFLNRRLK